MPYTMECVNIITFIAVLIFCHIDYSHNQELEEPPNEFPTNNKTFKIISGNESMLRFRNDSASEVPLIFPSNSSAYPIIHNETILRTLVSHTSHLTHVDTEVSDLLQSTVEQSESKQTRLAMPMAVPDVSDEPELDAEPIQSDKSMTEDVRLSVSGNVTVRVLSGSGSGSGSGSATATHTKHEHIHRGAVPFAQGPLAGLLAAVAALIAVACYVALLVWRRILEHRYKNRELLVNENDEYSYSDIRNFEL